MQKQAMYGAWQEMTIEEQADVAEKMGADTLYRCPDPWAVRRQFTNEQTGEVIRARCNRWECPHCGPRKVDLWRQLVKEAQPTLHLVLTKAGKTVEQAARALTTFMQALRRGSKGKGKDHVGARPAYPAEYFAVLEEHKDMENVGFHWHVLLVGVDHIPYKDVIKPLWMSATHFNKETGEGAENAWIRPVRNAKAVGYATKYLMKAIALAEKGMRTVKRVRSVASEDAFGDMHFERKETVEEAVSKARRIRYSRHFFPDRVAALRVKLFAGIEQHAMEPCEVASEAAVAQNASDTGKPLEAQEVKLSSPWRLVERDIEGEVDVEGYKQQRYAELVEGFRGLRETDRETYRQRKQAALTQIAKEVFHLVGGVYRRLRRKVLVEALEEKRVFSRRVVNLWDYQRKQIEQASRIKEVAYA